MSRVSGTTADVLSTAFYGGVATVALAGQTTAAVGWLRWPVATALPAVALLELGGIALAARADYRRRLGEQAIAARILSAAVAVFAVVFNWIGHTDHRQAAFFAGMSALGYTVWLINSGDRRRDQLRAAGMLPTPPPVYGWYRWLRRPAQTAQARAVALSQGLGLYASLGAVQEAKRAEQETARQLRRNAAIAEVLKRRVAASTDRQNAELAIAVFDLDEIARRLADDADYDGLTELVGSDLVPARLLGEVRPELPPAPAGQTADQPAATSARKATGNKRRKRAGTSPRRSPEETRTLAAQLRTANPEAPHAEIARLLGISATRLRQVEKPVNGAEVPELVDAE